MNARSDAELLRAYARAGDEAAFRELVSRHVDLVYSAALRQTGGRTDLAQDVSQVVFVTLARKAGALASHPSLPGWLFTCTRYVASRMMRSHLRRALRDHTAYTMNEADRKPELNWAEVAGVLDEVLYDLGAAERGLLLLRFFERRSLADIGRELRISEEAARKRVDRALEKLRIRLGRRGITSTASALAAALAAESVHAAPPVWASGVASTALADGAAGTLGLFATMTTIKSIATSGAFLGLVALAGVAGIGVGVYFQSRVQAAAAANVVKSRTLERRFTQLSVPTRNVSSLPSIPDDIDAKASADLQLLRLQEQVNLANTVLAGLPKLRKVGVSEAQIQQLLARAKKMVADADDLKETAKLSGTQIQNDPELKARADALQNQWIADEKAILGPDLTQQVTAAFAAGNSANQNPRQVGEAEYLATQIAGLTFATDAPLTGDQRNQMTQLLISGMPNYGPNDDNSMTTVNWNRVVSQAEGTMPAAQVAALKTLQASAERLLLEQQAKLVAQGEKAP